MDFIQSLATDFVNNYVRGSLYDHVKIVNDAKHHVSTIRNISDKIKYLTIVIEGANNDYTEHLKTCQNPHCPEDKSFEYISYYLTQELEELGVIINEDAFTSEEKAVAEEKLQQIINELQTLKNGHQIIYDQLVQEINDLKDLIYLGKKKWYRQLLGFCIESAASGAISEATAKPILEIIKKDIFKPFVDMVKDGFSQLTQ